MRIAIVTSQVPFIRGGAEYLAESLRAQLLERGHAAEIVSIPFKWYPPERLLDCMLMSRLMDVTEVNGRPIDRVIALKYPAYYCDHPAKVCWILHQHRQAYDLYETEYGDLHQSERGRSIAREIRRWDNLLLPRASALYTIADTVTDRLRRFNRLQAQTLYHPPQGHLDYFCDSFGDFILYPGRFDNIKRQHLLVQAIARTRTPVRAVLIGSMDSEYGERIRASIAEAGLADRVECLGVVDHQRKLDLYARCLAVYNGVYDEDYGYLTLEGFFAGKPVVTHSDSGGPLEFVRDGESGLVTAPDAGELALVLDRLFEDRQAAERMGSAGRATLSTMRVDWDHTIGHLLQ